MISQQNYFNDALNTFFFNYKLYCVRNKVTNHSKNKRENPLPPFHGLIFPISSTDCFISIIPKAE